MKKHRPARTWKGRHGDRVQKALRRVASRAEPFAAAWKRGDVSLVQEKSAQ